MCALSRADDTRPYITEFCQNVKLQQPTNIFKMIPDCKCDEVLLSFHYCLLSGILLMNEKISDMDIFWYEVILNTAKWVTFGIVGGQ